MNICVRGLASVYEPENVARLFFANARLVRRLPHHLVEAFKSTLEEARYSDIILHVVDCSNPQMDVQMHVVYDTLRELGVEIRCGVEVGKDVTLEIRKNGVTYTLNGQKIGPITKIWYNFDENLETTLQPVEE